MSDIKFKASVDSKKGEVSLKELDKGVGKIEKSTKKAGAGFKQMAVGVAAGAAAFYGATKALRGLVRWTGESIKGALDAEKAEKKLEAVLKSTAEAAGLTKDELVDMAKALQAVTTYEDDVIMGAEHLLLTFTKIGKEIFPEALETVLDMSQAMGTDLRGASIQLGKALQDPILGATALRRVGVNLSKSMMEQIKVFVESGHIMKAQRLILGELATEFGGTARAVTETFGGSLIQLKNTWRELQDEVGEAIIANEAYKDSIKDITKAIRELIETGKIRQWTADVMLYVDTLIETHKTFWGALKKANRAFEEFIGAVPKGTSNVDEYAEAMKNLREALDRAGIEQINLGVGTKYTADEMLTLDERMAIINRRAELLAFKMEDVWDALRVPSELMAEWDALFALVETPELDLAFEQFAISAEDNFANVMESLGFFVREQGEGVDTIKTQLKELSEFEQMALAEMSASYQGFIGTILGVIEKWAVGEIVKSVMVALPFPINILATAGAIAAVKAIFAGIKGMEKGGWVGLQGPEIIKVGERGPEYVTSNSQITNIYNQPASQGRQRIVIQNRITIGEQTFYKETVKSVNLAGVKKDIIVPIAVVV